MSGNVAHYLARIVFRDGVERYLGHGRATTNDASATLYASPAAAWRAIAGFKAKRTKVDMYADVIDTDNPERSVAA